jgi:hypothetical protein
MAAQRRDESADLVDAYWAMIDLPNSAAFRLIADENKIFVRTAVHTSLVQIICDVQGLRLVGRSAHGNTMTSTSMQPTAVNGDAVGEVEMYQSSDGSVRLDVRTDGDTVWLTRQQIGDLFGRDVKTIGKHVANARREELADESTVAKFATVQQEGDRAVER